MGRSWAAKQRQQVVKGTGPQVEIRTESQIEVRKVMEEKRKKRKRKPKAEKKKERTLKIKEEKEDEETGQKDRRKGSSKVT